MSVARITEISSSSNKSFEDAIAQGVARAAETIGIAQRSLTMKRNHETIAAT